MPQVKCAVPSQITKYFLLFAQTLDFSSNSCINISILILILFIQLCQTDQRDSTNYTRFGVEEDYSTTLNAANRLYKELFQNRNYYKDLVPLNARLNENSTVKQRLPMTVTLQILYVIDLDAARQVLRAYMALDITWQDIRLAWDPEEFDGIPSMTVQCDSLWIPEDFMMNIIAIDEIHPDRFKQCKFYSNGTVKFEESYNADIQCSVNVAKFPFDTQECNIQFATPSYEWYQVNARGKLFTKYGPGPTSAVGNGEFLVKNVTMQEFPLNGNVSNDDIVIYFITIKREPSFYIYVITMPCFLLTFLSIVGCFWTTNVEERQLEKLAIALTSMMSMTTFVDMVSQQMPKTNHFPLLGTFVLICVFITSAACVVVVSMTEEYPVLGKTKTS
ncbi:unnamed protein product, partial [Mesorhabditis belari]|uniref:Neurotransmitter-gated ion-channel ligand-binding domain-containing protein n=1 Tax=Mesorhabditis belari TaxID=2138241 RepID=A0AAF3FA76_9BILA